jgi:hypothetical protein
VKVPGVSVFGIEERRLEVLSIGLVGEGRGESIVVGF